MMYANPTDLHADISCWDTLIRELGEEEEEGDVKGEKSMMGIVALIFIEEWSRGGGGGGGGGFFFFYDQWKMDFFFFLSFFS